MSTQRWIRAFIAGVVVSLAAIASAQPPSGQTESSQQSQHGTAAQARAIAAHAKPQIVYNVRSRETAEALHAQSKPATDVSLPIDANMPISLQLSRSNANADAAAARAAEATPLPTIAPPVRKQRTQSRVRNSVSPGQTKPIVSPPNTGRAPIKKDGN